VPLDLPGIAEKRVTGKNILMVLSTKKFPPDGRVQREARDLIRNGHNLFLMARRGPGQSKEEVVEGVRVYRVPLSFQKKKAVADFIYFFFQRYSILFRIIAICRKHKIDVLHVHDLPYALATTLAGKLLKIPVIFDMHEHYTAMLAMSFEADVYKKFKPLSFVLLGLLRCEEKIACRRANTVIVVAEEHIDRIAALGVNRENIVVVTNTEDVDYFSGFQTDRLIADKFKDDFVILYVGSFSPHRGLDTAIKAMPEVLDRIPNAKLLLVGDGNNRGELEGFTKKMGLSTQVVFTGFKPFDLLPTYIRTCDVGLIPHISTPHIESTMPNKIFQFMMLSKPVIVSSTKPMMRVVEDARCGLVFQERNPRSLAKIIIEMRNESLRKEFGQNGASAVRDRYNWRITVQALVELYKNI
jgi:glycosyltransferase involved in cell wall biosynthesis